MGLFGKNEGELEHISGQITKLKTHLNSLFQQNRQHHEWISRLHTKHDSHSHLTSHDMKNIRQWIDFFRTNIDIQHQSNEKLRNDVEKLENSLKSYIFHHHSHMIDLIRLQKRIEALEELSLFRKKPQKTAISQLSEHSETKISSHFSSKQPLSSSEQWLMNTLFSEASPLSYIQLSAKTGKSLNTLRVYMNSLKKQDFIEETSLPNGTKLFSLKSKEKVNKLYALKQ